MAGQNTGVVAWEWERWGRGRGEVDGWRVNVQVSGCVWMWTESLRYISLHQLLDAIGSHWARSPLGHCVSWYNLNCTAQQQPTWHHVKWKLMKKKKGSNGRKSSWCLRVKQRFFFFFFFWADKTNKQPVCKNRDKPRRQKTNQLKALCYQSLTSPATGRRQTPVII